MFGALLAMPGRVRIVSAFGCNIPTTKTDIEKLSAPALGVFFVFFQFGQVLHAINFGVVPIT
jgi:hypothetical protein